jgi:hypothetical protein
VGHRNGASALGLKNILGLGSYRTAWAWLHKLRRAMVTPNWDRLGGAIEADETSPLAECCLRGTGDVPTNSEECQGPKVRNSQYVVFTLVK